MAVAGIAAGAAFVWFVVRWLSPRPTTSDGNRIVRWTLYNFASSFRRTRLQPGSRSEKALYYCALLLTGVGLVLVLSPLARLLGNLGNYDHFEAPAGAEVYRGFGGLILTLVGRFVMNWAALGWRSVAFVSEPEATTKKLVAAANNSGGPVRNVTWDLEAVRQIESGLQESSDVSARISCSTCRAMNDRAAKSCARCGAPL